MGDRGIIFAPPMVRALLDGRKTQTRRLFKARFRMGSPVNLKGRGAGDCSGHYDDLNSWGWPFAEDGVGDVTLAWREFWPFAPGDRLWVRENWHAESWYDRHPAKNRPAMIAEYRQPHVWYPAGYLSRNGLPGICVLDLDAQWSKGIRRPGMHMPRWASRLTLTVTDVRVQRLQEISEADAIAEGIERCDGVGCSDGVARDMYFGVPQAGHEIREGAAREAYFDLWDSLHNPRGLCADDEPSGVEANPWIVAVSFDVRHGNIDAEAPKCTR